MNNNDKNNLKDRKELLRLSRKILEQNDFGEEIKTTMLGILEKLEYLLDKTILEQSNEVKVNSEKKELN
ncbi:hypothetical protein WS9_009555 [Paraclostridium sordellii 8483]|uniref:hypothetical protein n=1 Tax=Paraclostridium sordellii TaxID=1505 RepID=UPI0002D8EC73|nr:hypothetical protein [Paeniclostridium sordellii]TAN66815.1 hypothetical protein WS9_009555 [Paeniclostridium sordellii 8483]